MNESELYDVMQSLQETGDEIEKLFKERGAKVEVECFVGGSKRRFEED